MNLSDREILNKEILKIKEDFKRNSENGSYDLKINIQECDPVKSHFFILIRVTDYKKISGKLLSSIDVFSCKIGVYYILESTIKEQIKKLEKS